MTWGRNGTTRAVVARVRAAARAGSALAARVPAPAVIWLLTVVSLYLAYRHALPCADALPDDGEVWRKACYNDIQPLYSGRLLNEGVVPYLHYDPDPARSGQNVEYPVLIGVFMAAVGLPVHALAESGRLAPLVHFLGYRTVDEGLVFFWATTAVLAVLALVTTWAMLQCRRTRPWDVLLWAVAPALILHSTINWDLLAVALTVLALVAWGRNRPTLAGVLLGLGAAAKLYPLVVLGPLVLLCLRVGTARSRDAAVRLVSGSCLAWAAVNLPVLILDRDGWAWPYRFSAKRWVDWGSLWFTLDQIAGGVGLRDPLRALIGEASDLNKVSIVVFGLCCLGIAALVRFAPQPPRVAAMAFLVVAAFLLTNKVWSPQFVLWLLPLAVLARPRWGWFLLWQAAEVTYLFSVFRAVLGERDGYALIQASALRWLAVAVLAGLVVVEALHPERDVVRAGGRDDPDGGVLRRTGRVSRSVPHRRAAPESTPPTSPSAATPAGAEAEPIGVLPSLYGRPLQDSGHKSLPYDDE